MARHELGDMELLRQRLEDWLNRNLRGVSGLSLAPLEFPESSGESSVTLLLSVRDTEGPRRLVCRMQPRESEVFDSHDLGLQYGLMQRAGAAGVPVPDLLGFEADATILGSDFYIMDFVDGLIPTDNPPYAFGSWVTELSGAERSTMWRNGIAAMAQIHCIDPATLQLPTLPRSAPNQPPMQHELDKFAAMLEPSLRKKMDPLLGDAFDYLQSSVPATGSRRLCWGDARPGNVIWRDLAPAAIIDWEMASLGDPLADASWWFWIDYVNSVGLGVERLAGLPQLDELYSLWSGLTGLPTEHSAWYDLFSVTRYAIILERKFAAMEAAGMGRIDNFAVPFVREELSRSRGVMS